MDVVFYEMNHVSLMSITCSLDDVIMHAVVNIAFTQESILLPYLHPKIEVTLPIPVFLYQCSLT